MSKTIPVETSFAEWRSDPKYVAAYDALEEEFSLAAALIEARAHAGLTQQQLAERMNTTQAVIARLESGRVKPSTRTLERLAAATGMRLRISFEPLAAESRRARGLECRKPTVEGQKRWVSRCSTHPALAELKGVACVGVIMAGPPRAIHEIMRRAYASFVMMIVPLAANMPPTPWQTLILAPGTCAGAVPRICRTLSCKAYMPYMPECM